MIEIFFRYLKGYVRVILKGEHQERFFNLVNARGINIWDVSGNQEDTFFCIACRDVYRLKAVLRKTKMRIHIKERHGLPFFLFYNRKRKMFFAGLFCSWLIVYAMSLYIWNISFEGNLRHTDDELSKFLETLNVDEGMQQKEIDPEMIEKALRNEYFDITWASVEIKGTKLVIHIRENNSQIAEKDKDKEEHYGDVICNKTAVVTSIITRTGTPMVKCGDMVNQGDILIAGKYQIFGDDQSVIDERFVRADGDVTGQVTYDIDFEISRSYTKKIYTGNEFVLNDFTVNDSNIDCNFWFQKEEYKLYDIVSTYEQMVIGESFYLPVFTERKIYKEYRLSDEIYSEEEIKAVAEKKMMYILKKIEENTIQILDNNVKIEIGDEFCRVYGQITALQNIGSFGGTYE